MNQIRLRIRQKLVEIDVHNLIHLPHHFYIYLDNNIIRCEAKPVSICFTLLRHRSENESKSHKNLVIKW